MPKIPTILGGEAPRTNYSPARADVNVSASDIDASAGLIPVARGMQDLSEGLQYASRSFAQIQERQNRIDDAREVTTRFSDFQVELDKWQAENHQSETYAKDFEELARGKISEYGGQFESSRAAETFNELALGYFNRNLRSALHTTAQTKLGNAVTEVDQWVGSIMESYRNARTVPNNQAEETLLEGMAVVEESIDTMFGDIAPETARKLRESANIQAVMAVMETNPQFARKLLARTADIDEERRYTLMNRIEAQENTLNIVSRDAFDRERKDHITGVMHGRSRDKIPIGVYELHYSKERAIVEKRQDDHYIDVYNKGNTFMAAISEYGAQHQLAALGELSMKRGESLESDQVYQFVDDQVTRNVQIQEKAPVTWLEQNNSEVRSAVSLIADARDEETTQRALRAKHWLVAQYQGNPPPGASPDEAKKYLKHSMHEISVMAPNEAKRQGSYINEAAPQQAVQRIREILAKYPEEFGKMAFKDLVKHGDVKQEYQLAFQNADAWWVGTYLGAVENIEYLGKLNDVRRKDLDKRVESEPLWRKFAKSMVGDSSQRAKDVEGYKAGIQAYAVRLEMDGKSIGDAVETATKRLIDETMGFVDIHGQTLAIPREGLRTDDEIEDIGRRLQYALSTVDPRKVDVGQLTAFRGLAGGMDRVQNAQKVRDFITRKGVFQLTNDGKGVTLYVKDDDDQLFQLRDKDGDPFQVSFEQLPRFEDPFHPLFPVLRGHPDEPVMRPKESYPLIERRGSFLGIGGTTVTNWPTGQVLRH